MDSVRYRQEDTREDTRREHATDSQSTARCCVGKCGLPDRAVGVGGGQSGATSGQKETHSLHQLSSSTGTFPALRYGYLLIPWPCLGVLLDDRPVTGKKVPQEKKTAW